MSFNAGMRSSVRGDWKTPRALYAKLTRGDAPLFDVSDRHGGTFDAFINRWPDQWFCNPPYGCDIEKWVTRMVYFWQAGARGVALLPARTDTAWFHDYVYHKARIEFIRGRLHFDDLGPAPFPSMLAYYE